MTIKKFSVNEEVQPLVSVIMNCYNGEKYLADAINSVLNQSYYNYEIIFWDNQSTDKSAKIFKSYTDPRLKYYYASAHTWLYEARNKAIDQASGDFIAFLDVDDKWLPTKLEKQMSLFSDPKVGIVCGNYLVENERKKKQWIAFKNKIPTGHVLHDLLRLYFVGLLTLVVRKSALDMLSYRCDPRYHVIGDFDLVVRLSVNWLLDCVQEPVAIYRLHESNESAKYIEKHILELECWLSEIKKEEAIYSSRNYRMVVNNYVYLKAINESLRGRKMAVYELFRTLPFGKMKLRLLSAMLLPTYIVRKIKN